MNSIQVRIGYLKKYYLISNYFIKLFFYSSGPESRASHPSEKSKHEEKKSEASKKNEPESSKPVSDKKPTVKVGTTADKKPALKKSETQAAKKK
jgi:hypothetical protein